MVIIFFIVKIQNRILNTTYYKKPPQVVLSILNRTAYWRYFYCYRKYYYKGGDKMYAIYWKVYGVKLGIKPYDGNKCGVLGIYPHGLAMELYRDFDIQLNNGNVTDPNI